VFSLTSITTICTEYTNLTGEDIQEIYDLATNIQMIADLAQANIFIDCPTKDHQHAIVVAEAIPSITPSLYTMPVVGKFAYESYEPAVILTHKTGKPTIRNRAITQEGKSVKQSVVPIKNKLGATIGSLIMEQDISEQIHHENRLKELSQTTEQLSQTLIGLTDQESIISDMIQESLFLLEVDGRIMYANSCAINLVVEMEGTGEIVGSPIVDHLPFLQNIDFEADDVLFKEITAEKKVFVIKRISLRNEDKQTGVLLLIRDLTELREKERQLMVKSAVIKEIHHRVKNNLQTVASLLRLQMKRGVPKESLSYFQESLNRILSIATVHEVLCNSGLDDIEILELMKRIGHMLVRNRECIETDVTISFEGEGQMMKSDKAISLALLINELVQNSLKHAFRGREKGEIKVCFIREGSKKGLAEESSDHLVVKVIDNGLGYSMSDKPSLGLDIVNTIIEHDLSGQFQIRSMGQGTEAVVRFPLWIQNSS
jgi:two-component sensor histidine kinase